ncbi:MAG: hypothetical protein JSR65_14090 [Proteobacteria bacterium]|nr:hypothetical protein [Pseudomonadota bacterium]
MHKTGWGWTLALLAGCSSSSQAPLATAPPSTIVLTNADFEAPAGANSEIPGWQSSQHAGPLSYKFEIDHTTHAAGAASLRIERTREQVYGMIAQEVPIAAYAGRTIELSAQMKTADVGPAGWELMLTFSGGVANARRQAKPLSGTQDFQKIAIRTQVPAGAQNLEIAALLNDRGTAWIDDVQLHTVD